MVLYPNKLPESERVCSGICRYLRSLDTGVLLKSVVLKKVQFWKEVTIPKTKLLILLIKVKMQCFGLMRMQNC